MTLERLDAYVYQASQTPCVVQPSICATVDHVEMVPPVPAFARGSRASVDQVYVLVIHVNLS